MVPFLFFYLLTLVGCSIFSSHSLKVGGEMIPEKLGLRLKSYPCFVERGRAVAVMQHDEHAHIRLYE